MMKISQRVIETVSDGFHKFIFISMRIHTMRIIIFIGAILTFGRRFGRRWDRLTRSESSDFLSTSGRKKRWNLQQQKSWNDSLGMGKSSVSN